MILPWTKRSENTGRKAVAYYRHSAQDRQEHSIEIQQEQVRKFAEEQSIDIVREFADRGKSGLVAEGRDAFNEMINDYVIGKRMDFEHVLVLDVSRWGRFQETDVSAYYTGLCLTHGKQVIFTTIGFPKQNDLLHGLQMSIERYRAAAYSRELSSKVWNGGAKIAADGFWASGIPPYGMLRLLLDEQHQPVHLLKRGEHKAIQNQRVTLIPGNDNEVAVVKSIFDRFVYKGFSPAQIAELLNEERIASPTGIRWSMGTIMFILRNEVYTGEMVWNRLSEKMKSKARRNPKSEWIRAKGAFPPIIGSDLFQTAQQIIQDRENEKRLRRSQADMLAKLSTVYQRYGVVTARLIGSNPDMKGPSAYKKKFSSVDCAYQGLFKELIDRKRSEIITTLKNEGIEVEHFDDFLVVDNYFSVSIQPTVPIPHGYEAYWVFHPDARTEVDLTIGALLSCSERGEILGYLAFPRMMCRTKVRVKTTGCLIPTLWVCSLVALLKQLRS